MKHANLLAISVLALGMAAPAAAQTITFDDIPAPGNNIFSTVNTGGFTFTGSHFHIIDSPSGISGGGVGNGTQYLLSEVAGVSFSRTNGALFSLNSADIAELFLNNDSSFQVVFTGNVSGGGTLTSTFTLDQIKDGNGGVADFQTVGFAGWNNLTSVGVTGRLATGAFGNYSIDNLVVNATGGVPEPATWAMMMLGFGGMGYAMRRKSKVDTRVRLA